MKKYRIIIFLILCLFVVFSLTGCQNPTPVKIVKSELNLIQELDEPTIKAFISYENMMHTKSSGSELAPETTEAIQLFFKNFRYRILSYSTTDLTATVNVEIKNIDTKALAKDLCLELIAQSIAPDVDTDPLGSMNSYFLLLRDILSKKDYDLVKTTAHFDLVCTDNTWTIQSNETLEDELVGGFISYLHDPYLITPEEITSMVFEMFHTQTPEDWISYLGMSDIFSTYSTHYEKVDLALATQISKCFSYKILSVTEQDNKATATVDITSLNLESVLDIYLDKLLNYASTTDAVRATDTELADKTATLLIECLNSNTKTYTKTIEISFINNGVTWEMQLDDEFTDALLGNMKKAVETFQNDSSNK